MNFCTAIKIVQSLQTQNYCAHVVYTTRLEKEGRIFHTPDSVELEQDYGVAVWTVCDEIRNWLNNSSPNGYFTYFWKLNGQKQSLHPVSPLPDVPDWSVRVPLLVQTFQYTEKEHVCEPA